MAAAVITDLSGDGEVMKFSWTLTSADATGTALGAQWIAWADRTVYFFGTWGAATAVLEGGDGTTYLSLTDPQGNAISKTADAIEGAVAEVPEFVRPRLSTAGTGASIVVTMIARRSSRKGAV